MTGKTAAIHQVIVIHGGDTPETYEKYIEELKKEEYDLESARRKNWKQSLEERLGNDFAVYLLRMPSSGNAKYLEWKIWFDKVVPQLQNDAVLIGHSLGGIFLAKYLAENKIPVKIRATLLIAPPFDDDPNDPTIGNFILTRDLNLFAKQGGIINVYHSVDDPLVEFKDSASYKKLLPSAVIKKFENRGHFIAEEFPEIVADIKSLFK